MRNKQKGEMSGIEMSADESEESEVSEDEFF